MNSLNHSSSIVTSKRILTPKELLKVRSIIKSKVTVKDNGCWEYPTVNSKGYSEISFKNKRFQGHRLSYEAFRGKIPNGLLIRHMCHNRPCVNPEHLKVGTNLDNARDRDEANRAADTTGSLNGNAKLCEYDVAKIKQALKVGIVGQEIADHFNVGRNAISDIKNGKKWSHVNL